MNKNIALCVDIGGTSIKFSIINNEGKMLTDVWSIPTNLKDNGAKIPEEISIELKTKLIEKNISENEIAGIGIGICGFATLDGKVKFSGNIGWRDYDISSDMKKWFNLPISVHNDCDMAALGERFIGAAKNVPNSVFITLGTGMGAGIIINGQLYMGSGGNAGELGHIPLQGKNAHHKCTCGLPECAEPVFSATGLINIYKKLSIENDHLKKLEVINGKNIWDGVKNNDELCEMAAREFAVHGGRVVATAAMTYNPDRIILGGGLSNNNDKMLEYINEEYKKYSHDFIREVSKVVLCEVGNDSALFGAAYAVFQNNK